MKKLVLLLGVLALSFALVGSVQAANAVAPLVATDGTATLFSDNSAEFLINVDGSTGPSGAPTVTVGDILIGIVGINSVESNKLPNPPGSQAIGAGTLYNEVTGILALKIDSFSNIDLGPPGADDSFGPQNIDLGQYTSVPLTAADAFYFDWSSVNAAFSNDGSLFGMVFEDASQDYTRDGTVAAGYASAINGPLRLAMSMLPANNDFVSVIAPIDVGSFLTIPAATAVDNSNIAFQGTLTYQDWPGLNFNQLITGGNGGFSSPAATSSWPIFDNLDFTVTATAAEPASMLLLGTGFIGLAAVARRRFKK